jgi:hypothetical protein
LRLSWSAWSSRSCRIDVTIPGSHEYSCLINRAALLCTISIWYRLNWRSAEAQLLCKDHQRLEWSSTGHSRNWWLWGIQDQPHSPQKPVKSHEVEDHSSLWWSLQRSCASADRQLSLSFMNLLGWYCRVILVGFCKYGGNGMATFWWELMTMRHSRPAS